jgi:hypothetical protein
MRRELYGLMVLTALMSLSCSQSGTVERQHISGKVSFKGTPLTLGRIDLIADVSQGNQGPTGFAIINNGQYDTREGKGPVPGSLIVQISWLDAPEGHDPEMGVDPAMIKKYSTTIEVSAEHDEHDFDITTTSP